MTLAVTLAMLKTNMDVHADVQIYDWRGGAYDCVVRAPDIYGVMPKVSLRVGYTGHHYFSVIPCAEPRGGVHKPQVCGGGI